MTTPTRSPSPRRAARKPTRSVADFYRRNKESIGPALIITVIFHVLLFQGVRHSSLFLVEVHPVSPAPMTVNVAAADTVIPPHLLPPEMRPAPPRLVDVNPLAPSQKPDHMRNTGAADQRAAQPNPEPDARGDMPRMDGESSDSTRIVNAIPRELLPKELRPQPGSELGADTTPEHPAPNGAPKADGQPAAKPKATDGPSDGRKSRPIDGEKPKGAASETTTDNPPSPDTNDAQKPTKNPTKEKQDGEKDGEKQRDPSAEKTAVTPGDVTMTSPNSAANAKPRPRPRATIAGTSGPLAKNMSSAGEAGVLGMDSVFSTMGEYSSRMMETIQAAWWISIERSKVSQRGHVVIEFTLHRDGTVTDVKIIESSTDRRAAYLCKDSIVGRAPFDPWPEDMVGMFGESQTGRITFHYRGM